MLAGGWEIAWDHYRADAHQVRQDVLVLLDPLGNTSTIPASRAMLRRALGPGGHIVCKALTFEMEVGIDRLLLTIPTRHNGATRPENVHLPREGSIARRVSRMRPSTSGMVPATTFWLR